jgi:hypothetical protein
MYFLDSVHISDAIRVRVSVSGQHVRVEVCIYATHVFDTRVDAEKAADKVLLEEEG